MANYQATWTTYGVDLAVKVAPRSQVVGKATVTSSNIDVPFNVYSKAVAAGSDKIVTKGVYHGTTYWNIKTEVRQSPLPK
jgi:hypothetical protein